MKYSIDLGVLNEYNDDGDLEIIIERALEMIDRLADKDGLRVELLGVGRED